MSQSEGKNPPALAKLAEFEFLFGPNTMRRTHVQQMLFLFTAIPF